MPCISYNLKFFKYSLFSEYYRMNRILEKILIPSKNKTQINKTEKNSVLYSKGTRYYLSGVYAGL
jgi:hypothetical protein